MEADFALQAGPKRWAHDTVLLGRLLEVRHGMDRPVIIEGVFVLRALKQLGIEPDYVIGVSARGRRGSHNLQYSFRKYRTEFPRTKLSDYRLSWVSKE